MPKVKEVSEYLRKQIIQLHSEGISYWNISTQVNVPYSSVGLIICKFKEYGTTVNLPRAGAPRKIGLQSRGHLLTRKEFKNYLESSRTKVSERTISRELHGNGIKYFTPRKNPMLTKKHVASGLQFCKRTFREKKLILEDCYLVKWNQNWTFCSQCRSSMMKDEGDSVWP